MAQSKLVSKIKRIDFSVNSWLNEVQEEAINLANNSTDTLLRNYELHADTMSGLYICSDTFKELLPSFEKKEDRALVNDAIHNASAVLAATQFEKVLKRNEPNKTEAIFVTGIPGAGKTTSIKKFMCKPNTKLIFEGQLANPTPSIPKIQQCLDKVLNVTIAVVHIEPEKALENTFRRFNDYGRGGSIEVMSNIQGNLPNGIKKLKEHFGDEINIVAIDRNNDNKILQNEAEIEILINIGTKDEIFARLKTKLDKDYQDGKISKACFNQANKTNLTNIILNQTKSNEITQAEMEVIKKEVNRVGQKVLNSKDNIKNSKIIDKELN